MSDDIESAREKAETWTRDTPREEATGDVVMAYTLIDAIDELKRVRAAAETCRDYFDRLRLLRATGYDERSYRKAQGHSFGAAVELIAALDGITEEEAFSRWHEAEAAEAQRDGRIRAELAAKYPAPSAPTPNAPNE